MVMMMAMLLVVLPVSSMTLVMIPNSADISKGSEVAVTPLLLPLPVFQNTKTDKALSDALKSLVDGDANEKVYGRIPKVDSSEFIVDCKTVIAELSSHYSPSDDQWIEYSLGEVKEFKNDSKKTVNYMVKEFEMKKSADQYARAALLRLALWIWVRFTLISSMMTCSRK